MRLRERLPCAVGNVFNDTYRQLQFSFAILFLMKVIKLSASHTGLILLIIQISDALISPLTGYLGDRVDLHFVAKKISGRKSWHLFATILMAISVPLLYNRCFLWDISNLSWLPLVDLLWNFWSATGGVLQHSWDKSLGLYNNCRWVCGGVHSPQRLEVCFRLLYQN